MSLEKINIPWEKSGQDGQARSGKLKLSHAEVLTPVFMPVGTRASVKALTQEHLETLGFQLILANTYHLYLRPGHKLIDQLGGLHSFMSWSKGILTDSGGFQIFSLAQLNKKTIEGVCFQSHIDGSYHLITPEVSMEIQRALGSDIVMCFDDCPKLPASKDELRKSLDLTYNWAQRCKNVELKSHQNLFGIIQGGLDSNLRQECLEFLMEQNFAGLALGGLSVGEKNEEMRSFLQDFVPKIPAHYPRYLMGVGTPTDVLHGISVGIDMFDCVLPTRNARNGQAFTRFGPINIKNARFAEDQGPLDQNCGCQVCSRYSKAYLRHLYLVGEYSVATLLSYHNLFFMKNLVDKARESINSGGFLAYYQQFMQEYSLKVIV